MREIPTEAQMRSMLKFAGTSTIASKMGVSAKSLQELRRIIRELDVSEGALHQIINMMKEKELLW